MFHPDNIKNYTLDGAPVSISLHHYWQLIGGPKGLAKVLNTNLQVTNTINTKDWHTRNSRRSNREIRTVTNESDDMFIVMDKILDAYQR